VLITPDGGSCIPFINPTGQPWSILKEQLQQVYALCGDRIRIRGSAVTGYGEDLIKNAFRIDLAWWRRWRITRRPAISARTWISSSTSAGRT
jgi:hypothetical protein